MLCNDCGHTFTADEAGVYQLPPKRFCTGWDIDHENAPCCPECGSLDIVEEEEDES